METYIHNDKGARRSRYVKRESIKTLIIGPLFSIFYMLLTYLSMSKWEMLFFIISPFLLFLMILFFIISPLIMLIRHNKTISKIIISDNNICITTFDSLWLKRKKASITKIKLKTKCTKFNWYGTDEKEGIIIIDTSGARYYLVKDYFNEYEFIKVVFHDFAERKKRG